MDGLSPRTRRLSLAAALTVPWILLAVHVYRPALSLGFMADDLFQISLIEGVFGPHSPLDLYAFGPPDPHAVAVHRARGSLPWWTVDTFRFAMLRPLASALLWFDHGVAPRAAWVHHLHSLGWFVAALLALAAWLRRLGVPPIAVAIAVTVYLVNETHAWLIGWLANRCALVSLTFCLLALHRHARWRAPDGRARDAWIEGGLWALAWAGGEYAAGGLGLLVADELLVRPPPRRSWRARGLALVPGLVPLVVYAVIYAALHYGVYGATTYVDPIHDPRAFVEALGHRMGRNLGEVWLQVVGDTRILALQSGDVAIVRWIAADGIGETRQWWRHTAVVTAAVVAVVGLAWGLGRRTWTEPERRALGVVAFGSLPALVPVAAIPPAGRSLAIANVAPALWLALVAVAAGRETLAWARHGRSGVQAIACIAGAWTLVVVGLWTHVTAEFQRVRALEWFLAVAEITDARLYEGAAFAATPIAGKHVIVMAAPGLVPGIHGLSKMNLIGRPLPATWHVLSIGTYPHLVRRLDTHAIQLEAVGAVMQRGPEAELFRAPAHVLARGQAVDVGLFRAEVTRVRPGVGPTAITFTFARALDDPSLVFLAIGPHGLEPFELPTTDEIVAVKPPAMPTVLPRG